MYQFTHQFIYIRNIICLTTHPILKSSEIWTPPWEYVRAHVYFQAHQYIIIKLTDPISSLSGTETQNSNLGPASPWVVRRAAIGILPAPQQQVIAAVYIWYPIYCVTCECSLSTGSRNPLLRNCTHHIRLHVQFSFIRGGMYRSVFTDMSFSVDFSKCMAIKPL